VHIEQKTNAIFSDFVFVYLIRYNFVSLFEEKKYECSQSLINRGFAERARKRKVDFELSIIFAQKKKLQFSIVQ